METLRYFAELSISRGCGFAAIGIGTTMLAFAERMVLSLEAGGLLTLMTCLVLFLRSQRARHQPYKRTEVWIMLRPAERPDPAVAQQLIGTVLHETYLKYALNTALISAALLAMSFLMRLAGR